MCLFRRSCTTNLLWQYHHATNFSGSVLPSLPFVYSCVSGIVMCNLYNMNNISLQKVKPFVIKIVICSISRVWIHLKWFAWKLKGGDHFEKIWKLCGFVFQKSPVVNIRFSLFSYRNSFLKTSFKLKSCIFPIFHLSLQHIFSYLGYVVAPTINKIFI